MAHQILEGKKGIIFGALDDQSIAWKTAESVADAGGIFVLTNAPVAMRMGTINALAEKTGSRPSFGRVSCHQPVGRYNRSGILTRGAVMVVLVRLVTLLVLLAVVLLVVNCRTVEGTLARPRTSIVLKPSVLVVW